ncbi:MAG: hypothetical protein AVDCRST_MAG54-691, partial [uncultured Actinomycetospora sp.]
VSSLLRSSTRPSPRCLSSATPSLENVKDEGLHGDRRLDRRRLCVLVRGELRSGPRHREGPGGAGPPGRGVRPRRGDGRPAPQRFDAV